MKKSKTTLLVASLLCLGLGIGGVLAATVSAGHQTYESSFDKSVYLYWGAGESSVVIPDVNDLAVGTPQYRYVTCAPSVSEDVSGHVTLTFKIEGQTKEAKNYTMEGLKVYVYEGVTDPGEGEPDLVGKEPVATLDYDAVDGKSKDVVFAVEHGTSAKNYCMKFVRSEAVTTGDEWGGLMTISQAYGA